jgi:starch phosphorylase
MRVKQEMVLGIGGLRALRALGIDPVVCHMNEGHSAFLAVERVCTTMEQRKVDFETACELVSAGCVFTTHTPVEAGNDMFPPYLVESYLGPHIQRLGIDRDRFLGLGRQVPTDAGEPFCMTVLAIRLANHVNGVSKLHGKVSRRMWKRIWPDLPEADLPIGSITNGIHTRSYLGSEMGQVLDRYFGPEWVDRPLDADVWKRVDQIPDLELWRTHERRRERLVAFTRRRLRQQLMARGASAAEVRAADEVLDPEALTIGFARRFATYKRGSLLFRDLERIRRIVTDADRPIQFVFAGKAHPRDQGGKELIQQIIAVARQADFRRRVVFIEDYDINVCRYLVQGVDVWLNNPRRPLEASGTSGMKAPVNGGINCSVLDGWWCEAAEPDNGWSIGSGEEYSDLNLQDEVESRAIYDLLENEIVPEFYRRQADGLPRDWIRRMKRSMISVCSVYNTNRMVREYAETSYLPTIKTYRDLINDDLKGAKALSAWLKDLRARWEGLKIEEVHAEMPQRIEVGRRIRATARINTGGIAPESLAVELYYGQLDANGQIVNARTEPMKPIAPATGPVVSWQGEMVCDNSGQFGLAVRVTPTHPRQTRRFEPGLIRWG